MHCDRDASYNPRVKFFGSTTVTTIDEPNELQFVVTREKGAVEAIAVPILMLALVLALWFTHHYSFSLLCALVYIAILAYSLRKLSTRLVVCADHIIASGNIARVFGKEIRVETAELKSIGYFAGIEDELSGLYAFRGHKSICLIPGIEKLKAQAIAEAIHKKFPSIKRTH
jgi:hypothetical protein